MWAVYVMAICSIHSAMIEDIQCPVALKLTYYTIFIYKFSKIHPNTTCAIGELPIYAQSSLTKKIHRSSLPPSDVSCLPHFSLSAIVLTIQASLWGVVIGVSLYVGTVHAVFNSLKQKGEN